LFLQAAVWRGHQ